MASISDDLRSDLAWFADKGINPVQEGEAENGTLFAYLETDLIPGTMLELVSLPKEVVSAFKFMHDKAAQWKVGDPAKYTS